MNNQQVSDKKQKNNQKKFKRNVLWIVPVCIIIGLIILVALMTRNLETFFIFFTVLSLICFLISWLHPNIFYGLFKTRSKASVRIVLGLLIFIFFIISISINGPSGNSGKSFSRQQSQNEEQGEVKKEEQSQEDKKLGEDEKSELKNFYDEIMKKSEVADEAYNNWANGMADSTLTQAYMDAEDLKKIIEIQRKQINSLEVPNVDILAEDKEKLSDAKSEIGTMYFTKIEAIELTQDYLNTQDMEKMSKAKEEFEICNSFLLSATGKIVEVFIKYDIPLEDNN